VRHVDGCDAYVPLQATDLVAHPLTQLGVQVAERLVKQQQTWVVDQGAGQRHPLLLAAAQAVGVTLLEAGQSN
jgi:hypothetical protein